MEESEKSIIRNLYQEVREYANILLPAIAQRNQYVQCVARALLDKFDNIKPFVLDQHVLTEFNLEEHYGMRASPLFNLNEATDLFTAAVRRISKIEEVNIEKQADELLELIDEIRKRKLLGRNTVPKLAYIQNLMKISFSMLLRDESALDARLQEIQEATIEMLLRQKKRLKNPQKIEEIETLTGKLNLQVLRHKIHKLASSHPSLLGNTSQLMQVYSDEIAQCIGDHLSMSALAETKIGDITYRTNKGIEAAFSPRNKNFTKLGDVFGDCTALEVKDQVDTEIANIHWTVYSWLLDPYYRVIEVFVDGEPTLKGHITPLVIQDRQTLMVDAIEVVPKLRSVIKGKKNLYLSKRLFDQRQSILNVLFETAKAIAAKMGIANIHLEKFSNATWVRDELDMLPSEFYHVKEVHKPFNTQPIKTIISNILGETNAPVMEEIQAMNTHLWDQGLRPGYKEVGLLSGEPQTSGKNAISGP